MLKSYKGKDAIILYSFQKHNLFFPPNLQKEKKEYCLIDTRIIFDDKKVFSFHDNYKMNYYVASILKDKSVLGKKLEKYLIDEDDLFIPPILNNPKRMAELYPNRRLGDSKYKLELGNIDGYWTIVSSEVFKGTKKDVIYIAFKIKGDFFHYKSINELVIEKVNSITLDRICSLPFNELNDDFIVLKRMEKLTRLSNKETRLLDLETIEQDTIKIPISE